MSGFTFAGEHSSLYHVSLLRSPESVLPSTRDRVIVLGRRHGAWRAPPDFGERELTLECWLDVPLNPLVIGQRQERLRAVAAWLNPLRGVQPLRFDFDTMRQLNAQVTGNIDSRIEAHQGMFAVSLVCPDPFWYSVTPQLVTMTTSPLAHTQLGTAPADPLLRLQGTSTGATGQEIRITIGAQTVAYRGALSATDWLEIDCRDKTVVRLAGATRTNAIMHMAAPIFPQLAAGSNTVTVSGVGGATWSRLEMHCRNRWF